MSANQSNLGNPQYGYDLVVATTQESINATMKEYLYNTVFTPVKMYWNQDNDGNPVPVSYDDLMQQTNGTDPLTVHSWNSSDPMTPEIQNINNSNFYFAFEAAIGIPSEMDPSQIPDIVTLQVNSNSVVFSLLCAQFTVVTCNFGRHGLLSLLNVSQPENAPWMFTSTVALKDIFDNENLPPDVQKELNNLGPNAFSVQQLLFDLDNAALESVPVISGIEPGTPAYNALSQVFTGAYFEAMKKTAQPVLNYSILPNNPNDYDPSTFTLTDLALEVSPYVDPTTKKQDVPDLNTLNYLGAINDNSLPASVQFSWNWIDQSEEADFNGVVSIRSDNFIEWIRSQFSLSLNSITFKPNCKCWDENWIELYYQISFDPDASPQSYSVINPRTTDSGGFTQVLNFNYSQYSGQDGGSPWYGVWGNLSCTYTSASTIAIKGNQIKVNTSVNAFVHVNVEGGVTEGNFASYASEVIYTLSVNQYGNLVANVSPPNVTDNSENPDISGWSKFTSLGTVNDVIDAERSYLQGILTDFMDGFDNSISGVANSPQKFVFPGGNTFTFKDVVFSDYQDLVSHITYVQPTGEYAQKLAQFNKIVIEE
ncbi:hypothetical protein [Olivibacter domesticus]|uniref:Uncharacterized protein n=1 Tax=Olivibacter domesticus TaxID=407022 RepID=A0A1H7MKJ4_OLID1|nr:hypothetical protein [Olivibacter domesticus]SEL11408.1 hypothetical protein SAMN05661044_02035 [Olivibacter domesticus]